MSHDPWIWCGAILTIMIFSFLWKENPLYRLAEHIFVGISVGYLICVAWFNYLKPKVYLPLVNEHNFLILIPVCLSILFFFRFSSKFGWLSYWPLAFIIGLSGYSIPAVIDANMLKQLQATINVPFEGAWWVAVSGGILMLGTLAGLVFFYFSIPHEGSVGKIAKFGSGLIMISFGASFGYTVMARISLLIGRVLYLLRDWLGVVQ